MRLQQMTHIIPRKSHITHGALTDMNFIRTTSSIM
uniref:Uncharacterized protein n=1 Tax=Arundo donax TaxID=35708 RepID=A0A0A9B6A8_ARUDO